MRESFETKLKRWYFNFFPAFRRTGGKVTYIASDWSKVHVKIPLNRKTRNYVGSMFGGSMYAAVDPIYMLMLIHILGPEYIIWDKAATIRFKKPGKSTLYARFHLTKDEIDEIKTLLKSQTSINRVYTVYLVDHKERIIAEVEKTLYIRYAS